MLADFHLGYCAIGLIFFGRSLLACRAFDQVPLLAGAGTETPESELVVLRTDTNPIAERGDQPLEPDAWRLIESPELRFVDLAGRAQDDARFDLVARARTAMSEVTTAEVLAVTRSVVPTDPSAAHRAIRHLRAERAASLWLLPRPRPTWTLPLWLSTMTDALPVYAAINRDDADFGAPDAPGLHRSDALRAALSGSEAASSLPHRILKSMRASDQRVRVAFAADAFTDTAPHSLRRLSRQYGELMRSLHVPNWLLAVTTLGYMAALVTAVHGPFATTAWGWFATAGWLSGAVPALLLARVSRIPTIAALFAPFAAALDVLLQIRSLFGRRATVATADS
ncbi:MAG: hypothetical protein AB7I19_08340 [Planctomycetota bacterium]